MASLKIDCDYCDEQDDSETALELKYHQVFRASESMSYALNVDWFKADESHSYGVEGTMYFTPKIGLALRAEKNTDDEYSDTDLTIKYQQFINDRVGLSASYLDSEYYGESDKSVGLVSFGVQVNI